VFISGSANKNAVVVTVVEPASPRVVNVRQAKSPTTEVRNAVVRLIGQSPWN
jgi:hypothetical protein